jgi:hypothetical protein
MHSLHALRANTTDAFGATADCNVHRPDGEFTDY